MNQSCATEELQKELASIANNFERITHPKWRELLPFKESIAELRRRGASFKTIAIILRKKSISVSHDTVARFCRKLIGQKSQRKQTHSKAANKVARMTSQPNSRKAGARSDTIVRHPTERGPRIARVEDL